MPCHAMPLEDLPQEMQAEYTNREPMVGITVRLYGLLSGESEIETVVPRESPLRMMAAAGAPPNSLVEKLMSSVHDAIQDAFALLMVDAGRLPLAARSLPTRLSVPALDLDVLLFSFAGGDAEVRLGMPDPMVFRRALADGSSLEDIARATTDVLGREITAALRKDIVERGILR